MNAKLFYQYVDFFGDLPILAASTAKKFILSKCSPDTQNAVFTELAKKDQEFLALSPKNIIVFRSERS